MPRYRKFGRYAGMRNFTGTYWSATTGRHLGYESWTEKSWAMVLDFDPSVFAIVSQPFQLIGRDAEGRLWRHTPDYLAERRGRPRLLLDVGPEDRRDLEEYRRLTELTRPVCESLGWEYRIVHQVPRQLSKNIDHLSAYRRAFPDPLGFRPQLLEAASESRTASELCELIGDPIIVLPQFFHLCWNHRLWWDVTSPFRYYVTQVVAADTNAQRRAA